MWYSLVGKYICSIIHLFLFRLALSCIHTSITSEYFNWIVSVWHCHDWFDPPFYPNPGVESVLCPYLWFTTVFLFVYLCLYLLLATSTLCSWRCKLGLVWCRKVFVPPERTVSCTHQDAYSKLWQFIWFVSTGEKTCIWLLHPWSRVVEVTCSTRCWSTILSMQSFPQIKMAVFHNIIFKTVRIYLWQPFWWG